jgi:hypothetical protein
LTKNMKTVFAAIGLTAAVTGSALAQNLVTNGGFEQTTNGAGQLGITTDALGWTVAPGGYTFLFTSGTADTVGSNGQYGNLQLWGPGNGSANGLPASSPYGGNYIAEDGAFQVEPVQQTVNGLTPGQAYAVNFDWAGAQQDGFNGPTTDQFAVSLGSETEDTPITSLASHGFSGWLPQTFVFTADNTSEVLSFLAIGTPQGEPPFALLDGVSLAVVPEPSPLVAMFAGVLGVLAILRFRPRAKKSIS